MPTPEQLGVACIRPVEPGAADWAAARQRLDGWAACFQLEKLTWAVTVSSACCRRTSRAVRIASRSKPATEAAGRPAGAGRGGTVGQREEVTSA